MEQNVVGMTGAAPAPTYLAWSIFNTLCCCLPLGILAIVFSCRTDTANTIGDGAVAMAHSRMARNLNIAALIIGVIFVIIFISFLNKPHKILRDPKHEEKQCLREIRSLLLPPSPTIPLTFGHTPP
ncbi:hypothetical protein Q7C36_022799 [Tachysurus vachellii]|uniref:Uncharacterized protein n=1 Tax=Tachysurus vachellii TaxID=175792 RepID=A0AA88IVI8_TACVA|nr:hypothetical protein Q7C36_022799 [Tachysurus vachellii]